MIFTTLKTIKARCRIKVDLQPQVEQIIKDTVVVDAHLDLLKDVLYLRNSGKTRVIETDYLPEFKRGGIDVVVSSLYVDAEYLPEMALRCALDQISCLYLELEESPDQIALCRNREDINAALIEGKIAILLSFEGVEPLGSDLYLLPVFYELGLRIIGLTWSRMNYAAQGSRFYPEKSGCEGGVTDFGVKVLEFAMKNHMLVDVSHINDQGFWDVLDFYQGPVIASHSNCRHLVDIPRNLSDDMIRAIAGTGGVVGINAVNFLAAQSDDNANTHVLVDHIDHIAELVGTDHIGFGFDQCKRIDRKNTSVDVKKLKKAPFDILSDYSEVRELVGIMISRGYTLQDIKKICGGNFLRVFDTLMPG